MKKLIAVVGLMSISLTALGAREEAEANSLALVSQFSQKCPSEFAQATNHKKSILRVSSVSNENEDDGTTSVMNTGYPAFSLNSSTFVTNRITLKSKISKDDLAPAGVIRFKNECKIESFK